ncbi:MAG TPA: hypothetical protein VJ983_08885, partial [candidate division Zixibacteria bacterium]|nr:hypothetical protein [candidate division Zixibacteria bacterium]
MKRLLKIFAYALLVLVILVGGLYLYVFKFNGLETIVNSKLTPMIERKYGVDVKVGKIHGGLWEGFTLDDISVFYQDSTYRYEMMRIPRLTTSLAFPDIWNMNFVLDYLTIDSATIRLEQDSTGHWLLPRTPHLPSSARASGSATPPIAIQNF